MSRPRARRSLLLELFALAVAVSVASVVVTAWLTVRTTAVAIQREQGQTLADEARIYDELLGYAATHASWSGAQPLVASLARSTGYRVALTTTGGATLLDSAAPGASDALPARPLALVDPLAVDALLAERGAASSATGATGPSGPTGAGDANAAVASEPQAAPPATAARSSAAPPDVGALVEPDPIDPRVTGPFLLPAAERDALRDAAAAESRCLLDRFGVSASVVTTATGRPELHATGAPAGCLDSALDRPTPTEATALAALTQATNACLAAAGGPVVTVGLGPSWTQAAPRTAASDAAVVACLDRARHDQLVPYVAPPAQLFVAAPRAQATTFLDLSPANRARIAALAALVLLGTLGVTAVVGARLVRPLRRLARAATDLAEGDLSARAEVRGGDEIGRVASAFNAMAARREQLEAQRTALMNDVAHELRTPLSNVRGWLEATQDGLVRPDDDVLGSLLDETALLQRIVDDLHDLALADAGALPLHPEPVDLDVLLEQVGAAHAVRAQQAGVRLVVEPTGLTTGPAADPAPGPAAAPAPGPAPDLAPDLWADPVRLRQVVGNLVTNALRHTPAGGTVTLRARREPGAALVEVADTGTGIATDDLAHVFDRFWRGEPSRNRGTGGSGLGLAIVRDLVEAHGGTVDVASTPGVGTVFTVRLPEGVSPDRAGM